MTHASCTAYQQRRDAAPEINFAPCTSLSCYQVDYPAACNAVEKVLVHGSLAEDGRLFRLQTAMRDAGACTPGTKAS